MIDEFLDLVPEHIRSRSGKVFYSGRNAFSSPSPIYLLGLNPGGDPLVHARDTIERSILESRTRESGAWSEYADECWENHRPGEYGMAPRILHLLTRIGREPSQVPASNVIFVRSRREHDLGESTELLDACWPVHEAVIDRLQVRAVLCLGQTAGRWVRGKLGADVKVDCFKEDNLRGWVSTAHVNPAGKCVVTLSHPSIANWINPKTDPTPLVQRALARS